MDDDNEVLTDGVIELVKTTVIDAMGAFITKDDLAGEVEKSFDDKFKLSDAQLKEAGIDVEAIKLLQDNSEKVPELVTKEVETQLKAMEERLGNPRGDDSTLYKWNESGSGDRKGNLFEGTVASMADIRRVKELADRMEALKAITSFDSTPGARQTAIPPTYSLVEMDPFRRFMDVWPIDGATFTVPDLSNAKFRKRARKQDDPGDGLAIESDQYAVENYALRTDITDAAAEDVPMLREKIIEMVGMEASATCGAEVASVILASILNNGAGTFGKAPFKTGVASSNANPGLPSEDDAIKVLAKLQEALTTPYQAGASYFVNQGLYATLVTAIGTKGGQLNWDGNMQLMRFNGIPIVTTSHIPQAAAANQCIAFYGNLFRATYLAERRTIQISEYTETEPGSLTYYASMRFRPVLKDHQALVGLMTGAN